MPEIPTQFRFAELLSHTFPGLFSALTMFMLIDIWSPFDLTLRANRDIASVLAFSGFVVVFGTILGVLIDGIHHSIIEDNLFKKLPRLRKIEIALKSLYPSDGDGDEFKHFYFSKKIGDKAIDIFDYLTTTTYRYSEFDANSFIALVPFSFVTPLFLVDVLHIPWILSTSIGLVLLCTAFYCLNNSYDALVEYRRSEYSVICGYLNYFHYIYLTWVEQESEYKLSATICDKNSKLPVLNKEMDVIFKSTLGHITPENKMKTDRYGVARATLSPEKSEPHGIAIIYVTSENCIPGVECVRL